MEEQPPTTIGPEQRYWRRRANRRVRKARLTRGLVRLLRGLTLHTAIVIVVLFGVGRAFRHVSESPALELERVELRGIFRAQEPQLRRALDIFLGQNLMEIDLDEVAEVARRDIWVRDAQVRRVLPDSLCVELDERAPSALALIDGTPFVIDSDGLPVGVVGPGLSEDLPMLTGLDDLEPAERESRLAFGIDLLARLREVSTTFTEDISELDLSSGDRLVIRTVIPGPQLLLDPHYVERNVKRWLLHQEGIESRAGGAEYVDLRWRNRITVMPANGGNV
jgi:cell division protein FtsQ